MAPSDPETPSEQSPTPKLSFYPLPSKPSEPPGLVTPPRKPTASVPFKWEEEPGKPRPFATIPETAAKGLELPPRLLSEAKVTNLPSPTTVLDGPYVGSGRSMYQSLSFRKIGSSSRSPERRPKVVFGSSRWGSFRSSKEVVDGGGEGSTSFRLDGGDAKVKITRVTRKGSLLSSTRSQFWASIYEGLKQVVPWKSRQEKLRKMTSR